MLTALNSLRAVGDGETGEGRTSAGGGRKKEDIKAEEFKRSTVGLMFMWWNIIVRFLPWLPVSGVDLRIRPGFVLDLRTFRALIYLCSLRAPVLR